MSIILWLNDSSPMATTMRFRAVDTFRGLAALLVILFHLQHLPVLAGNAFIAKSDIFVDFFFVLSGFVITYSSYDRITTLTSIKPFIVRRFKRLYPLHLFTLLLVLLFEFFRYGVDRFVAKLSNPVFAADKTWPSFLANLTLTQSLDLIDRTTWNGPSWSISVEFYTYLVWALCLVLFRKNLVLMCGLCFGLIMYFIVQHHGNIIYNYDYGFVRCLYSFLLGMLTYRLSCQLPVWRNQWVYSLAETLLLAFTIYAVSQFTHAQSWFMPFLFVGVILLFSREQGVVSQTLAGNRLEFLGTLSYSYYLNHMIVLNAMDLLLFKIVKLPASPIGQWIYMLLCLVSVHVLSLFTYRHVEFILQNAKTRRSAKLREEATAF